jgi:carbohydrate-selective porin OprB
MTDTEINGHRRDEEARLLAAGFNVAGEQTREIALELNYSAAVYRGINLEPGLQIVLHPGALSTNAPAWVLGLRTSVKF